MSDSLDFKIGQSIRHPELGDGVVVGIEPSGFVQVFFRTHGERMVPATTLEQSLTWEQQVISGLRPGTPEAVEQLWLALEAAELPLMESAATLTSAKVDLLPHQVVLVHRIANASPRRFLIADEVGLGKTIETALVLRELASGPASVLPSTPLLPTAGQPLSQPRLMKSNCVCMRGWWSPEWGQQLSPHCNYRTQRNALFSST